MAASLWWQFSRLSLKLSPVQNGMRYISTQGHPLAFRASTVLNAEPMKKRRRVDINIVIQKEQKKRKRIEKAIRKLKMKGRILKPIDEIEGVPSVMKTMASRKREPVALTFEESERRALLHKEWARYKYQQYKDDLKAITMAISSQQRALEELRKESEELYQQAIQIDMGLLPLEMKGPTVTPPIKGYDAPDGDYADTTKVFDK